MFSVQLEKDKERIGVCIICFMNHILCGSILIKQSILITLSFNFKLDKELLMFRKIGNLLEIKSLTKIIPSLNWKTFLIFQLIVDFLL